MTMNPTIRRNLFVLVNTLACALATLTACRTRVDPARAAFSRGVEAYLERRGDLCVGRPRWPMDVPAGAEGADAAQLPVLQQLGLVTSTTIQVRDGAGAPFQARRYQLTSQGRRLYLDRETRLPAAPDDARAPQRADLCFARLTLGQVTRWEIQKERDASAALVSYTYDVEAPAVARDPRFAQVFPAVARVLAGGRKAELVEGFTLTAGGWMANELIPRSGGAAPQAAAP